MQQIKTAVLSYGMSGKLFHTPFLHVHPGFRFYAVWERSKNLAQQDYPDVKTYRTLDDLLADEEVELVIVNTPNYSHYEYAKKALLAGKHVIVEKPFTGYFGDGSETFSGDSFSREKGLEHTLQSISRMLEAEKNSKGRIMYAENWVYAPSIQKEKELLE